MVHHVTQPVLDRGTQTSYLTNHEAPESACMNSKSSQTSQQQWLDHVETLYKVLITLI
jgi:hypothetical protein